MAVTNYPFFIDQHNGRPCPYAVAFPDIEAVVLHHRKLYSQARGGILDAFQPPLPEKLRRVNADNRKPIRLVSSVPLPQLRDNIAAVNSAVRPEFYQYDSAFQISESQRLAVDPAFSGYIRRGFPERDRRAKPRRQQPNRKEKYREKRYSPRHGLFEIPLPLRLDDQQRGLVATFQLGHHYNGSLGGKVPENGEVMNCAKKKRQPLLPRRILVIALGRRREALEISIRIDCMRRILDNLD